MKKAKDLIALRLRCLLNGDFDFDETVESFYQDFKDTKVFNSSSFMIGVMIGSTVALLVMNYVITN